MHNVFYYLNKAVKVLFCHTPVLYRDVRSVFLDLVKMCFNSFEILGACELIAYLPVRVLFDFVLMNGVLVLEFFDLCRLFFRLFSSEVSVCICFFHFFYSYFHYYLLLLDIFLYQNFISYLFVAFPVGLFVDR